MKKTEKAGYTLIDMHTHILPKMDDGSKSIEESVELIRLSYEQGVRVLSMTPHFYPGNESPEHFLERRDASVRKLAKALTGMEEVPEIYFGAEVEFFQGISRVDEMERLTIGESGILLVEMPFSKWTGRMVNELYELRALQDVTPLIAHVDRYLDFGNEDTVDELIENGILIQANASFFLKGFASRKAMRMIRQGKIHFLGSDCHNLHSRRPNLKEAAERIKAKCGEETILHLEKMQRLMQVRGGAD